MKFNLLQQKILPLPLLLVCFWSCVQSTQESNIKNNSTDIGTAVDASGDSWDEVVLDICKKNNDSKFINISGSIKYNLPIWSPKKGLNLGNPEIKTKPSRYIQIGIFNKSLGCVYKFSSTDKNGHYEIRANVNQNIENLYIVAIGRVMANEINSRYNSSDKIKNILFSIVDNTSKQAVWVILSREINNNKNQIINITARIDDISSGPFSIVDAVVSSFETILSVESEVEFQNLKLNWSTKNVSSTGDIAKGEIGTSYWDDITEEIYILGQPNVDTDEYDWPVIIHEFAHYLEYTLFRSDSIGGEHHPGAKLDIRVAFSEGWGNFFSSIVRNDPIYYDTSGMNNIDTSLTMDVEANYGEDGREFEDVGGLWSESSVHSVLWDLHDDKNENWDFLDNSDFGFKKIYNILKNYHIDIPTLTSLLSFSRGVIIYYPALIDNYTILLKKEQIEGEFLDDFGTGINQPDTSPENCRQQIYFELDITKSVDLTEITNLEFGGGDNNKYCSNDWFYFKGDGRNKTINVAPFKNCDMDWYLYDKGKVVEFLDTPGFDNEEKTVFLVDNRDYILDVRSWETTNSNQICKYRLIVE